VAESFEQFMCIAFDMKLGKTASEIYRMLQYAFVEEPLSCTRIIEWFA
jgi:hypothetical protein